MSVNLAIDNESGSPKEKTPTAWHGFWQQEMDAAEKRLRRFSKQGVTVTHRYLDERANSGDSLQAQNYRGTSEQRLNLFHTNVATMEAMLFGQTPKIDVSREFQDPDDDVARVAALLYQRMLEADTRPSGDDLGTTLRAALQDRLLPGLGVARVRYEAEFEKVKGEFVDVQQGAMEGMEHDEEYEEEEYEEGEEREQMVDERCLIEYCHWQDCRWGWGRTFVELPWWAFRAYLTLDEATERFGETIAKQLEYKNQTPSGTEKSESDFSADQKDNVQKAAIWEIWSKKEKKVFWYAAGAPAILDMKDDPLQLAGFFPIPRPMVANPTTTLFQPRADFIIAQDLYNEVDILHSRIATITMAVKVIGVYDKNAADSVGRMFKEGVENDMIPVDNWAMFAEKGGLQGCIDWFPVQDVVGTLQTLIQIRDQTIELLYQVTGMSDILRGANTDQYTSDGTNQLKAKFGSIRVQALQDEFARFASDLDALKAEVIGKHFDQSTIIRDSSAGFLPKPDLEKVPAALELMQSSEIVWRVNIRPESIAMIDYAQLKSERTEFLVAMSTYIQSASTAAKAMPGALPVLLEMMKWGMAGFKGAGYLEGIMDQAIDGAKKAEAERAQNPQPDPEKQRMEGMMKLEQLKQQGQMQHTQAKSQADMSILQAKFQTTMQTMQLQATGKSEEEREKMQNDIRKIREDFEADMQIIQAKLDADLQVEQAQAEFNTAEREIDHNYTTAENAQLHRNELIEEGQRAANVPRGTPGDDF